MWGLNVDQPPASATAAAAASSSRTGLEGEGRGRGKGEAREVIKEWDQRADESVWVESQDGACSLGPSQRPLRSPMTWPTH